jgi:hypothetical protein
VTVGKLRLLDVVTQRELPPIGFIDRWGGYDINPEWTCGIRSGSGRNDPKLLQYWAIEDKPKGP